MSATPSFRKGAEAAKEASKGGKWAKTQFFGLENGKQAILRFLTDNDEWIVVDQHNMIPTKPQPKDYEGNWPERMGCVCRKDEAFDYGECYICENLVDGKKIKRPSGRNWALACMREEVVEGGKVVGIKDGTREVTRKVNDVETTTVEKDIVVVNMGFKNFFSALSGFGGHYGTVTDRDYVIKRDGTEKDTTYSIIPLDPIDVKGARLSKHHPEWEARYASDLNLEEVVADRASDEFYARFFDPRFTVVGDGDDRKVVPTGSTPEAAKPENDVSAEKLAAVANRVKGYVAPTDGNGADPSGATPEVPAAPAAAAQAPDPVTTSSGGMKDFG